MVEPIVTIEDEDVLIRRIPPSRPGFESITPRSDGGYRASSAMMATRDDEHSLSCSLLRLTPPARLLEDLRSDSIDPNGWHVCRFLAKDVRELGLEVVSDPTERDPGHCSISGKNGVPFPSKAAKKLANRTVVLAAEDIQ